MTHCSIRDVTAEVGAAVLRAAVEEDLAEGHGEVGARELSHMSKVCNFSRLLEILIYIFLAGMDCNDFSCYQCRMY